MPPPGPAPPVVSVVTIFLDAERFLAEAIESVRAQTMAEWELLLVDDGSTDASAAIARGYAARDPGRIRVLEHPGRDNRGMSASRNLGLRHVRGTFVAFLDADDVYLPEKLERQVAVLAAQPAAGVLYGATEYWYSWTGRAEDRARDRPRRRGLEPGALIEPPSLIPRFVRDEVRTPATCGVLVRRHAAEGVGGFEERFAGMFEDQAFFYKLCAEVAVLVDAGCYDRYRQHAGSWSQRALARGEWDRHRSAAPARREFYAWVEGFLGTRGLDDPELMAFVRREQRPVPAWRTRLALARAAAGRITAAARRSGH